MDSQNPNGEYRSQSPLLLRCHVQTPDSHNRDNQDHYIGSDIDYTCADQDCVSVHALLALGHESGFADAFKSHSQDKSDCIEEVPPEDEPD